MTRKRNVSEDEGIEALRVALRDPANRRAWEACSRDSGDAVFLRVVEVHRSGRVEMEVSRNFSRVLSMLALLRGESVEEFLANSLSKRIRAESHEWQYPDEAHFSRADGAYLFEWVAVAVNVAPRRASLWTYLRDAAAQVPTPTFLLASSWHDGGRPNTELGAGLRELHAAQRPFFDLLCLALSAVRVGILKSVDGRADDLAMISRTEFVRWCDAKSIELPQFMRHVVSRVDHEPVFNGLARICEELGRARGTPNTPVPESTARRWIKDHFGKPPKLNGKISITAAALREIVDSNP